MITIGYAFLAGAVTMGFSIAALFFLRFVTLPWAGPGLNDLPAAAWFIPILVAATILGALYYSADA